MAGQHPAILFLCLVVAEPKARHKNPLCDSTGDISTFGISLMDYS